MVHVPDGVKNCAICPTLRGCPGQLPRMRQSDQKDIELGHYKESSYMVKPSVPYGVVKMLWALLYELNVFILYIDIPLTFKLEK